NSVSRTDQIADRLRREASRVTEKAQLAANRHDLVVRLEELAGNLVQAQGRLNELQENWLVQWRSLGLNPLPPREMRSWISRQAALVSMVEAIRKKRAAAAEAEALCAACRADLSAQMEAAHLQSVA